MNTLPSILRDLTKKFMRQEGVSQEEFALMIVGGNKEEAVSGATISNFLNNRGSTNVKTRERIEDFLKNNGYLTRLGLLTDKSEVPTSVDVEEMKKIGFTQAPSVTGDSELDSIQDEWKMATIIGAIVTLETDEKSRKSILGTLYPKLFPTLAKTY